MFGNKQKKVRRLLKIGKILRQSQQGISQADLARELGVSPSTIYKDLAVIQEETGILPAEDDDGRLHWFE